MAKFQGMIGYATSSETAPGVYTETISEKQYSIDIIRNVRRYGGEPRVVDDLDVSNTFSIIGDSHAYQNLQYMKYVEFMGVKWKIVSFEINRPRIMINVGGIWNG